MTSRTVKHRLTGEDRLGMSRRSKEVRQGVVNEKIDAITSAKTGDLY